MMNEHVAMVTINSLLAEAEAERQKNKKKNRSWFHILRNNPRWERIQFCQPQAPHITAGFLNARRNIDGLFTNYMFELSKDTVSVKHKKKMVYYVTMMDCRVRILWCEGLEWLWLRDSFFLSFLLFFHPSFTPFPYPVLFYQCGIRISAICVSY